MKKNIKTYLLLAVVAFIWGTIGYKIVSSLSSEPIKEAVSEISEFKPIAVKKKDTFQILADYRDPFLGTLPKKPVKRVKKRPKKVVVPEVKVELTGVIAGSNPKDNMYFVTINGKQHLMGVNDEIQKIKVLSGTSSSIQIRNNGKIKTITLKE